MSDGSSNLIENLPIGVFDSGIGGLTVLKSLQEKLPYEDILYLGDTARVPYGNRSRETIISYVRQDMEFICRQRIKAVIIACNTADAIAREIVAKDYPVPVFGVIEPTVRKAVSQTQNKKIGVIGTRATINSGVYQRVIRSTDANIRVMSVICPLLVPLVENGRFHRGDVVAETVTAEYLNAIKNWGADTLILGCTHYPLLCEMIQEYMPETLIISSAVETANSVGISLEKQSLLKQDSVPGKYHYYVTDNLEDFVDVGNLFLYSLRQCDVEKVSL